MADTTQAPINGTYATPHPYPAESYNISHAAVNNATNNIYHPVQSVTPTNVPVATETKNEIPKDEVGWFFVEQYYTTMSRNPEKLHLFYDKRSQFVSGNEAESVPIVIGQKAINQKIRELDYHDCKVRVLNVDSQASFDNILVAVVGEISNRSEPSRKFAQTFVLAEQPNGYYVLNDIFRYLADEDGELVSGEPVSQPEAPAALQDAPVAAVEPEPEPEHVAAPVQADSDEAVAEVDEKLNHAIVNGELEKDAEPTPQVNGSVAEQEKPAVPVTPAVPVVPAEPEELTPERPRTPEPTPVVSTPKEAIPVPEKELAVPAKAVPKTWATIAAANRAAAAAAAAAASAPAAQAKAAAPAQASAQPQQPVQEQSAPAPATAAIAETTSPSQPSSNDGAGWQTAGHDHNKKQSRAGEEQKVSAYIKNVNEKVDAALLKTTLARFGKLLYFDVNRQKNCAFVDFADQAGYSAAVAANPHQMGSEQIFVEERRIRPGNFGNAYAAGRGGANRGRSDGRAGSQGRGGGFQRESGRGGFAPRGGRGGNVAAKGRSQPQAA